MTEHRHDLLQNPKGENCMLLCQVNRRPVRKSSVVLTIITNSMIVLNHIILFQSVKSSNSDAVTTGPATIEQLIHNHGFSKDIHSSSTSSKSSGSRSAYLMRSLKNLKPHVPFHLSSSASIADPVTAHGLQYLDTISAQRRGLWNFCI